MQLHPDLSFCRIEDRFIFLDLARDRYFSLGGDLARLFAASIDGEADPRNVARLVDHGVLVSADGQPLEPCPDAVPRQSILDVPASPPPIARVAALAWAFARMRAALRRHGMARPARALEAARQKSLPALDDMGLVQMAMAYDRLSVLRGAHDLCLPHAMALTLHLVRKGYAAQVVFGVQLRPFSAHCWVECGDRLVNDRFDRVRLYTPIRRL